MEAGTTQQVKTPEERTREAFDMLNRHDLSKASEVWGPDTVDDFVAVGAYRGTEAIADFFRGMMAALPDFSIEVERILADGQFTTVQWHARGTFSGGPFLGIEPTGRAVDFRGVDVMEWSEEGPLVHNTIYYDGAEFARQIGMLPPRDSAGDRAITGAFNAVTKVRARVKEQFG